MRDKNKQTRKSFLLYLTGMFMSLSLSAQDYSHIYLVGPASPAGWNNNLAVPLTLVPGSDAVYTWTGILKGGEFKFINNLNSWSNSFTAAGDGLPELGQTYSLLFNDASDRKFLVSAAGIYTLTVDMKRLTLKFASAAPTVGLSFNGTANSFIDSGSAAVGVNQFTAEAWVFFNSLPSGAGGYILSTEDSPAAGAQGFSLRTAGNKFELCIGNGNWVAVTGSTAIELGTWYHVAATCSSTQIKLYVNGILDGTVNLASAMVPSSKNLRIGESPSWAGRLLDGVISDLRFWNLARTITEINAQNIVLLNGNEAGLVANWKMNEGTGSVIADAKNAYTMTKPADISWFNGVPKLKSITNSTLSCNNKDIENAYNLAVKIVSANVRGGVLAAGAEYNAGWTRDCAINNMFGISFVNPVVAKNSMWNVTNNKTTIGAEYWDRIIWVLAALDYYKVNGDQEFLNQAYTCSANSMAIQEANFFDNAYGLFKGPSVFNDGISGYPQPVYDPTINSGAADSHPNTKLIKCLSTNCVYYGAYQALAEMGRILNISPATIQGYQAKAEAIKANILKYLYSESENKTHYLIDNLGNTAKYQEGLGISFATLLGVLTPQQAQRVIKGVTVSNFGITSIYPDFSDFSPAKPGRHNNIIWPHVNAYFAQAAISVGDTAAFKTELNGVTRLALDKDKGNYDFCEVYNPYTGIPDGGWQNGGHWAKITRQTWCATGYMNMVYNGLLGMRFGTDGITFSPFLPVGVNSLELKDIPYRQAVLDVIVKGNGTNIKSFTINGVKQSAYKIGASIQGAVKIEIELENSTATGILKNKSDLKIKAYTAGNTLYISGAKDSLINVFSSVGKLVSQVQLVENEAETKLPAKGVYVVNVTERNHASSSVKVSNN